MPQPVDDRELEKVPPEPSASHQEESEEKTEYSSPPRSISPTSRKLPITDDLLTSPPEQLPTSTSTSRRAPLSTAAVHEELSAQLAQMATQLKRNAIHFSDTLERDQAVVEETQLKMESNYGELRKEQVRLRDHAGKSRGTTWLTVFSIVVVFVSFFIMFFIIRVTRW